MNSGKDNYREPWLDWLRCFAICGIVLVHAIEAGRPLSENGGSTRMILSLLHNIGRLGVPIFLFLTGYLITKHHRVITFSDYMSFLRAKWIPLLLCVELWNLIYAGFIWLRDGAITIRQLAMWLLCEQVPLTHWWYVYMILGLYLIVPIVSTIAADWVVLSLFALSCFKLILMPLFHFPQIDLSFLGDCYMTYLLFGIVAFRYREKIGDLFGNRLVQVVVAGVFVGNLCVNVFGGGGFWWYNHPNVITAGLFAVVIGYNFRNVCLPSVTFISRIAFPVYLLHILVMFPLQRLLPCCSGVLECFILWAATMAASILVAYVSCSIPAVNKWLFLTVRKIRNVTCLSADG